jgi:hypothetical protein
VVAVAGGAQWNGMLDRGKVVLGEIDVEHAERLGDSVTSAGSDERHDVLPPGQHPSDRDLCDRRALRAGDRSERIDERQVPFEFSPRNRGAVARKSPPATARTQTGGRSAARARAHRRG